jgi:putative endonuclease
VSEDRLRFGKAAELAAESFLAGKGYRILARGWRTRMGEVDLIARDGGTVVFVEVKARSSGLFGPAEAAVDRRKQGRIVRASLAYLQRERLDGVPVRFDVVALQGGEIRHVQDAFAAEGWTR